MVFMMCSSLTFSTDRMDDEFTVFLRLLIPKHPLQQRVNPLRYKHMVMVMIMMVAKNLALCL